MALQYAISESASGTTTLNHGIAQTFKYRFSRCAESTPYTLASRRIPSRSLELSPEFPQAEAASAMLVALS